MKLSDLKKQLPGAKELTFVLQMAQKFRNIFTLPK